MTRKRVFNIISLAQCTIAFKICQQSEPLTSEVSTKKRIGLLGDDLGWAVNDFSFNARTASINITINIINIIKILIIKPYC